MVPLTEGAVSARTRLLGVFGHPIRHSASPPMQNAGLCALGLDWKYVACDVPPNQLKDALIGIQAMGWIGVNLTVPHKQLALDLVDEISEQAKQWGAVNTVVFEGKTAEGAWVPLGTLEGDIEEVRERGVRSHGYNTDADAIVRSIREDLSLEPRGARVLLVGVGGAGRTAALRLADEGVGEIFLVNRTQEKAEALAAEIDDRYPAVSVQVGFPDESVELILNATSIGLQDGDSLPWDLSRYSLERADAVYDMIYRPAETSLLRAARAAGCSVANGLGMLLHQGVAALELWTGQTAPVDAMRAALVQEVYGN